LTLLQRELVFGCFPVDGVVEVHAGHVAVQVVPVQQESALEHDLQTERIRRNVT